MKRAIAAVLILMPAAVLSAQGPPPRSGPWNNDLLIYRVADGKAVPLGRIERGGVPTLARWRDERLIAAFQYFPPDTPERFDRIAVAFSSDEGRSWADPQTIRVDGLPQGMMRPFDPTLVPLPDGRLRLYFTGNFGRTFQESTPAIYSAISDDGVHFTVEDGVRFAVEGQMVIDCAVVLHQDVFHLYVPDAAGPPPGEGRRGEARPRAEGPQGVGYHAVSRDGLTFERLDDVAAPGVRRRWLGNAQSVGERITFFGTGDGDPPSPGASSRRPRGGGPWMATSTDGQRWSPAQVIEGILGADPAAVALAGGDWLVIVTSPPVRR